MALNYVLCFAIFCCFVILSGISKVIIPAAGICSRQLSNMELYDSEESCSSVSSSSYVFSASLDSQESSVDSYPRLPPKTVKKSRKRTPHILDKLYYREVGFIASVVSFVVDSVFLSKLGDVIGVKVGSVRGYLNLSRTGSIQLNF